MKHSRCVCIKAVIRGKQSGSRSSDSLDLTPGPRQTWPLGLRRFLGRREAGSSEAAPKAREAVKPGGGSGAAVRGGCGVHGQGPAGAFR